MGLNKEIGEPLAGRGRGTVVPVEKWDVLNMLPVAAQAAANEFHKLGAPRDITLTEQNVTVQEYHFFSEVIFIFWLPIKGEDHYYIYRYELGPTVIAEMVVTGKWPAIYAMPENAKVN